MATPQCVVRVQRSAETLVAQIDGWGTMVQSLPFRRHVEKAMTEGAVRLRVDLGPCQYLDSTFLGTLFLLKRNLERRGGALTLDAVSPACLQLLQQMGVDQLFPLTNGACAAAGEWKPIEGGTSEMKAMHCNVVQAHEELASMDGKIGETFRPVAQCLARDLEKNS